MNDLSNLGISQKDAINEFIQYYDPSSNFILENIIKDKHRRIFYILENHGYVESTSYETKIDRNNNWRIFEWHLKEIKIKGFTSDKIENEEFSIYKNNEMWEKIYGQKISKEIVI